MFVKLQMKVVIEKIVGKFSKRASHPAQVSIALQMVLMSEKFEYRLK
jgi:hypothetical protein